MKRERTFASDNNSGIHPDIMNAIIEANQGHAIGYGDDKYTNEAINIFKKHFGNNADVYFVYGGTGANVTTLKTVTDSFNSIICADVAHINTDECGAPEKFTGCKLKPLKSENGKINPQLIEQAFMGRGDEHHSQPRVVSITQSTEMGTVYQAKEIKAICDYSHSKGLIVHVDGARISNAVAATGLSLSEMIVETGVDMLSFGGTKNGMMFGEAVIFLNNKLSPNFKYFRKQGMQLASKMRFISAQFIAFFKNDLWLKNAENSNRMTKLLETELKRINKVEILFPVEVNAVFAKMKREYIKPLQEEYFFYIFDESIPSVRWMTSFDTTEEDIYHFVNCIEQTVAI